MCDSALKQQEENIQQPYDDIKIEFEQKLVLNVTVLRCRGVSVSYLGDKLDDPDPQIRVSVPDFSTPNVFTTRSKSNSPTSEINETFSFVAPKGFDLNRTPFLVQISLSDEDVLYDDELGTEELNILAWDWDRAHQRTLVYGRHGEVDIELTLTLREHPDFRFGFGLCEKEREFRMRRLPIVHENLKALIGQDAPRDLEETPVISLCTSGGGYKAVVGMSGAMEALKDAGILDVFTYAAALSGSAWYLEAIYAKQGLKGESFEEFQEFLKKAAQEDLLKKLTSAEILSKYFANIKQKVRLGQPVTLCDIWGFILGETFLGDNKLKLCQSEMRSYVEDGEVPLPLLVSLHVKNHLSASQFHAYMETSPYEVSFPSFGISLTPETWGSEWNRGIVARKCPEFPCHFHMGVTGSAFAVLATANRKTGEKDEDFVKFVDDTRIEAQQKMKNQQNDSNSSDSEELEENDSAGDEIDVVMTSSQEDGIASIFAEGEKTFASKLSEAIIKGRESVISRTGKILNFSRNLEPLQSRQLDPCGGTEFVGPEKEKLIKLFDKKVTKKKEMSTKNKTLSVVDAGIFNNLPAPMLLRPQRSTDMMLVLDFSAEPSDEDFTNLLQKSGPNNRMHEHQRLVSSEVCKHLQNNPNHRVDTTPEILGSARDRYRLLVLESLLIQQHKPTLNVDTELFATAAQCWREGLKFPPVDFAKISSSPPAECMVFADEHDDTCPVVVWLKLSNANFRKIENYKPQSKTTRATSTDKLNEFVMFGPQTNYGLFNLGYDEVQHDRLKELMHYIVSSNAQVIKDAIVKSINNKRKRIQRQRGFPGGTE